MALQRYMVKFASMKKKIFQSYVKLNIYIYDGKINNIRSSCGIEQKYIITILAQILIINLNLL